MTAMLSLMTCLMEGSARCSIADLVTHTDMDMTETAIAIIFAIRLWTAGCCLDKLVRFIALSYFVINILMFALGHLRAISEITPKQSVSCTCILTEQEVQEGACA